MSRYTEPRLKKMRALGTALPGLTSKSTERRPYPPGQHGQGRKKQSEYGRRLMEKQKLIFNYGVSEKQLRRIMTNARKMSGVTGDRLLQLLESRLDNAVFRCGITATIPAARQLITHGHVRVNGKKVDKPGYLVRAGETITLSEKASKNVNVVASLGDMPLELPAWLEHDEAAGAFRVTATPSAESVPFFIDTQMVVEHFAQSL